MVPESEQPERHDDEIVVSCLSCGRIATLPPTGDVAALPLVHLTRRLRCSECGSRAVKAERPDPAGRLARAFRLRMTSGRS